MISSMFFPGKDSGVGYLDVSRLLVPEDFGDGLHPNDAGHEKLFRAAYDFLQPILIEK